MSSYANSAERQELIDGLGALADYFETYRDIPARRWVDVLVFPDNETNEARHHEIDRIAACIGTRAQQGHERHYRATREFGPVEYRAVAIPTTAEGR